ncbi:MAG: HAD family phosphatase [Candidatus Promineifilaceae bacterium]|nr:HAD family phosphatase [Candidatus Promineifilaceae bacterium]
MIKAIIFDIGGVLVRTHDHSPRREWERRLHLAERESEKIVFGGEMGTKAQAGAITDEALWEWIRGHLALDEEGLNSFRNAFWAGDRLDEDLVALIGRLGEQYQTAVISNATDALRATLSGKYPIADTFDLIVCSAEEKVMKPETEIYQRTLERLGRTPQEAVFIDDNAENIAAARAMGIHVIHYREGMDVAAALQKLGVQLNQVEERTPQEKKS